MAAFPQSQSLATIAFPAAGPFARPWVRDVAIIAIAVIALSLLALQPGLTFHSVLFEVAVCIMAYTVVLMIELTPVVAERLGWEGLRRRMMRVLFVFVALGVLLPTMHQSSLGSLMLLAGPRPVR